MGIQRGREGRLTRSARRSCVLPPSRLLSRRRQSERSCLVALLCFLLLLYDRPPPALYVRPSSSSRRSRSCARVDRAARPRPISHTSRNNSGGRSEWTRWNTWGTQHRWWNWQATAQERAGEGAGSPRSRAPTAAPPTSTYPLVSHGGTGERVVVQNDSGSDLWCPRGVAIAAASTW